MTVTNGTVDASIVLLGQYIAADFHGTADAGGTAITYTPPQNAAHLELAAPHAQ